MLVGVRRCEAIVDVHVFVSAGASAGIYVHMDGKGKKRCKRRCKGKCKGKCVCPCKCSGKCACNGNCKCIHKTSNNKKKNGNVHKNKKVDPQDQHDGLSDDDDKGGSGGDSSSIIFTPEAAKKCMDEYEKWQAAITGVDQVAIDKQERAHEAKMRSMRRDIEQRKLEKELEALKGK